eukprot:scaffold146_cov146-Skeletonema_marinoi.AAC.1
MADLRDEKTLLTRHGERVRQWPVAVMGRRKERRKETLRAACRTVDGETTFGMIWLCMTHMY